HLLIVFQVLLVAITKSDEQSLPRYATNPLSLGQETLRIALARAITPTLATPGEPNSQLWRKPTSPLILLAPAAPHADDHQSTPRTPPNLPSAPALHVSGPPAPRAQPAT